MNRHIRNLGDYKNRLFDRIGLVDPKMAATLRDMRLEWFRITNQADEENAEVYIYDEIGGSFGVDANEFVQALAGITAPKITVRINSPGGSLFDSIAIHNALVQHPAKILTRVDALAASGASIIAMAGDEVEMMGGAQLMIHDALGIEYGNQAAFEAMAKFLGLQSDNIADMYKAKAGSGTREEWRARMLAETWMFADEAIALGLADRVYVKPKDDDDEPEEPQEKGGSEEDDEDEEVPVQVLMSRKHSLDNRGFKYSGRKAAPAPEVKKDDWEEVRALVANWK
jgi:ATP-dependent protease ClpP protease subunit